MRIRLARATVVRVPYGDDLAPSNTLMGALQRGRGNAARELLADADLSAASKVLECITRDPRWDRQVESRARYYAELAGHVGLPIAPIVAHIDAVESDAERNESDAWLATEVLEELAAVGHAGAQSALRRRPSEEDLPALAESWMGAPRHSFVDTSLDTAVLLAAATPWNRRKLVDVLSRRRGEKDRAVFVRAARQGSADEQSVAYEVLGRLQDARLIDEAIALFEEHALLGERGRVRGSERLGPKRYLAAMKPELLLPLAREWFDAEPPKSDLAESILGRCGTLEDGARAEAALGDAMASGNMYRLCSCVEILTAAQYWAAVDLVCHVDAEAPYSCTRRYTTRFLAEARVPAGRARLNDALWDCEDDVVLLAIEGAERTASTSARFSDIAEGPWHDEDVRHRAGLPPCSDAASPT